MEGAKKKIKRYTEALHELEYYYYYYYYYYIQNVKNNIFVISVTGYDGSY